MKAVIFLFLLTIGLWAQKPTLPLPILEVNQKFLKTCIDGEKIFAEVKQGGNTLNKLTNIVITLEYDLITVLENREGESKLLKPARICIKSLAERVQVYIKQVNNRQIKNLPKPEVQRW